MSTEISMFNGCSNCTFSDSSITIVRSNMNAGPGVVPQPSPVSTGRPQDADIGPSADYAELRVSDIRISARPTGNTGQDNATRAGDIHHSTSSPIGQDAPGGRSAGRGPNGADPGHRYPPRPLPRVDLTGPGPQSGRENRPSPPTSPTHTRSNLGKYPGKDEVAHLKAAGLRLKESAPPSRDGQLANSSNPIDSHNSSNLKSGPKHSDSRESRSAEKDVENLDKQSSTAQHFYPPPANGYNRHGAFDLNAAGEGPSASHVQTGNGAEKQDGKHKQRTTPTPGPRTAPLTEDFNDKDSFYLVTSDEEVSDTESELTDYFTDDFDNISLVNHHDEEAPSPSHTTGPQLPSTNQNVSAGIQPLNNTTLPNHRDEEGPFFDPGKFLAENRRNSSSRYSQTFYVPDLCSGRAAATSSSRTTPVDAHAAMRRSFGDSALRSGIENRSQLPTRSSFEDWQLLIAIEESKRPQPVRESSYEQQLRRAIEESLRLQ